VSVATVRSGGSSAENRRAENHGAPDHGEAAAGLKPGWGVSPERQQAIADSMSGLASLSGRLSPGQLRAITVELSSRRDLWADLVVHDPDVRWYLPLHRSNSCDVWLLAWERGQDTDWHDHGGSSGSFAVAEGSLLEQYRVPSGRRLARIYHESDLLVAEALAHELLDGTEPAILAGVVSSVGLTLSSWLYLLFISCLLIAGRRPLSIIGRRLLDQAGLASPAGAGSWRAHGLCPSSCDPWSPWDAWPWSPSGDEPWLEPPPLGGGLL